MNDIEIIKDIIYSDNGAKMEYIDIDNILDNECENFIQAIENLIQRNKDLEQIEKEHKEENGRLRDRVKELEKTDLSNSKIIANMSERHFHDREKIRELEAKNKELNIIRLNMLLGQFPDTTETYKKYKKELDELLKTS